MVTLDVNGKTHQADVGGDAPLLWVLRERLQLTGTKFGCGMELCGACTVLIDGEARRSCQLPVKDAQGKRITTIEGLPDDHPVKAAWIEDQVPQCGYCQSGQILAAAALLRTNPKPTDADIDLAMSGIICRCGTYQRIRRAVHRASATMAGGGKP
jgi:aerobic-type carbon monoxide dehydrogenase small subunit (CoxS/CutS family)